MRLEARRRELIARSRHLRTQLELALRPVDITASRAERLWDRISGTLQALAVVMRLGQRIDRSWRSSALSLVRLVTFLTKGRHRTSTSPRRRSSH
jgi:hypothetical protein